MRYSENFQGLFSCQTQELVKNLNPNSENFPSLNRFWNVIEQGFTDFQRTPSHTTAHPVW